jgi:hypothetical protein
MANSIGIQKAVYENEIRVAVFIPKEPELVERIKQIPDRRWNSAQLCWHFPNNSSNWAMFKSLFASYQLLIKKELEPIQLQEDLRSQAPRGIPAKAAMPQPTASETNKIMPSQAPIVNAVINLNPTKITVSRAAFWKGRLRLDFIFHPQWLQQIKQLEGRRWHVDHKCWTVPHAPMTVTNLQKLFGDTLDMKMDTAPQSFSLTGLQVIKPWRAAKKYEVKVPPKHKEEITRMEEKMMIKRMSFHTIKSYKNHFCHFIYYYNDITPPDISYQQIVDYILFRIKT